MAVVDYTAVYWAVLGGFNSYLSVYSAIFVLVTNNQTTNQPGDPRASLLLTSVRRQSFAIRRRSKGERQDSGGASANDVKVINTSAFINTKIDYGL